MESYTNSTFNFISDYKKDLQLSDFPGIEKAGYVDLEDVLKKGTEELKKVMEEEINLEGSKTSLLPNDNTEFEFQIVKFEKSFNSKDYLTEETPPKIITSVLLETMDVKKLVFKKKMIGTGGITRYLKNVNIALSEGDVINIKTKNDNGKIIPPINRNNMKKFYETKLFNLIISNMNYNFTFLIELDPLDD